MDAETATVLALPQRINADNANTVLQILVTQAEKCVDLSSVTYCDSAGIAVLLEVKSLLASEGKTISYQHPGQQLQDLATFLKVAELLFD